MHGTHCVIPVEQVISTGKQWYSQFSSDSDCPRRAIHYVHRSLSPKQNAHQQRLILIEHYEPFLYLTLCLRFPFLTNSTRGTGATEMPQNPAERHSHLHQRQIFLTCTDRRSGPYENGEKCGQYSVLQPVCALLLSRRLGKNRARGSTDPVCLDVCCTANYQRFVLEPCAS